MVKSSSLGVFSGVRLAALSALAFVAAACQTPTPLEVSATFVATPQFHERSASEVAVLPVEDGTPDRAAERHLTFIRQQVQQELVFRSFAPLEPSYVDASLAKVGRRPGNESILVPATLQKLAGHSGEDATFALRIDRWDESQLAVSRKLWFQFQAALVGSDGATLWSGTIQGMAKAGGAGPSPRDRDGMARSCAELAVREMMTRLPRRP